MEISWPLFWLILMIALFLIEAAVQGLVTLWFALGAMIASVLAWAGFGIVWQWTGFVFVSLISLLLIRKFAYQKLFGQSKSIKNPILDKQARVVENIDGDQLGKIIIGDVIWQAKSTQGHIEKGSIVIVKAVVGNVVTVERKV